MATAAKKQDMPPKGGYKAIPYLRVPAKTFFSGITWIGIYAGVTTAGLYLYFLNCKSVKIEEVEMRSSRMALYPMLLAERDREFLKQLRANRDEESKLMANVPGWKVGTWYGEPIYKTLPKDKLVEPSFAEFYAQTQYKHLANRGDVSLWI